MSLQNEFDVEISKCKGKIGEVKLFRCLLAVLSKRGVFVEEKHSSKGYIEFVPKCLSTVKKCEISDLFIIFIAQNQIRATFMQNKFSRCTKNDWSIKKVNTIQHALLSQRPIINPLSSGVPSNILHDAMLPGIASYGDFYIDGSKYGMTYFDAFTLVQYKYSLPRLYSIKETRYYNSFGNDIIFGKNQFFEFVHATDLNDFEQKYKSMKIGCPIECLDINSRNWLISMVKKELLYQSTKSNNSNASVMLDYLMKFANDKKININDNIERTPFSILIINCVDNDLEEEVYENN